MAKTSARILVCLLAGLAVAFMGAGPAAAQGGGSAGNSQYVDPLGGNGHGHHHSGSQGSSTPSTTPTTTTAPASGSSGTPSSSSPSVSTPSTASSTPANSSSTTTRDPGSSGTLPFTGLNLWACALLGVVLLGAGVVLRRALTHSE